MFPQRHKVFESRYGNGRRLVHRLLAQLNQY
jgi:hypothetical protein